MRVLLLLLLLGSGSALAQPVLTSIQELTASDAGSPDQFGVSVARDGDLAVVGAFYADCGAGPLCGAAYVFMQQPDGSWAETQKLTVPGAQFFGIDVGITDPLTFGDVPRQIVVGSYFDGCAGGAQCGAVYVFDPQPDGSFAQSQRLVASDAGAGDRFGTSLSTGGPWLTIGAPGDDCAEGADCGCRLRFVRGTFGDLVRIPEAHAGRPRCGRCVRWRCLGWSERVYRGQRRRLRGRGQLRRGLLLHAPARQLLRADPEGDAVRSRGERPVWLHRREQWGRPCGRGHTA